jgi:hypothetical protein
MVGDEFICGLESCMGRLLSAGVSVFEYGLH